MPSALALIDYKTNGLSKHKKQVANDEDVQLAFYVNLMEQSQSAAIADALYVGVEKDASKSSPQVSIGTEDELNQSAKITRAGQSSIRADVRRRASAGFGQITVTYCDYRAVCRKDYVLAANDDNAVEVAQ